MGVRDLVIAELNPPLNVTLVKDSDGLGRVADFFSRVDTFGYDVETNVVNDFTQRKLRVIQVGNKDEQYVIDLLPFAGSTEQLQNQGSFKCGEWARPIIDVLRVGLESGKHLKIGVNLQFDYETIKWGFGIRPWHLYDCQLMEKLIYCGRVNFFQEDFWGMKDLLLRYFGLRMQKDLQTSFDLETPLTDDQVAYCALDTRLPMALRQAQLVTLERAKLMRVAKLENNAIPAFGDMHLNGFYLDRTEWLSSVKVTEQKHVGNVKALDTYFIPVVGRRELPAVDLLPFEQRWSNEKDKEKRAAYLKEYREAKSKITAWKKASEKWEGQAAINYGSTQQLIEALRKVGFGPKKLPNTNDGTLEKLKNEPVIKALQEYRSTKQILKSFGLKYPDKYINLNTGRVHSKINQIGAETGRTTSSSPNLQQIPKEQVWRSCFKPRPGYKMVTVDMSGAELRIMAELSGEPSWLDAFHKNWDVHCMCAEMMYDEQWKNGADPGCLYVERHEKCECKAGHKRLRNNAKAPNFKLAYGGADLTENLGISKKDSDSIISLHKQRFPTLHAYLEASGKSAETNLCSHTFSGRRRLFEKPDWTKARLIAQKRFEEDKKDPLTITSKDISRVYNGMFGEINRAGKNTPIQGGNIDIAKVAIGCGCDATGVYLWHRLETEFGAYMVNFVHDEVVVEAPEDKAEDVMAFIKDCILRAGREFMSKLDMESEGKVADCWSK